MHHSLANASDRNISEYIRQAKTLPADDPALAGLSLAAVVEVQRLREIVAEFQAAVEPIIEEVTSDHDDLLTAGDWNLDCLIQISLTVEEVRTLATLAGTYGAEPET